MHKPDLYAADQLVDCEQWYIHVQGVHVVSRLTFQLQWYAHVINIYTCIFLIVFPVEFIHLVSSEANDICNRQLKKTILPEHVFQALQVKYTK